MIWKLLMVAGMTFRKLHYFELLVDVAAGAIYKDGVKATSNAMPRDPKITA